MIEFVISNANVYAEILTNILFQFMNIRVRQNWRQSLWLFVWKLFIIRFNVVWIDASKNCSMISESY